VFDQPGHIGKSAFDHHPFYPIPIMIGEFHGRPTPHRSSHHPGVLPEPFEVQNSRPGLLSFKKPAKDGDLLPHGDRKIEGSRGRGRDMPAGIKEKTQKRRVVNLGVIGHEFLLFSGSRFLDGASAANITAFSRAAFPFPPPGRNRRRGRPRPVPGKRSGPPSRQPPRP
jgi:hypothetical protein